MVYVCMSIAVVRSFVSEYAYYSIGSSIQYSNPQEPKTHGYLAARRTPQLRHILIVLHRVMLFLAPSLAPVPHAGAAAARVREREYMFA